MEGSEPLKNGKHEKFAVLVAGGVHPSDAYSGLYSATKQISITTGACRLVKSDPVSARIKYIKVQAANEAAVDLSYVIGKFKHIADRCSANRQTINEKGSIVENGVIDSVGACKALDSLAKHVGMYEEDNNQKAVIHQIVMFTSEMRKHIESQTIDDG